MSLDTPTKLPSIPRVTTGNLERALRSAVEIIRVREGQGGDRFDQTPTFRDLFKLGLVRAIGDDGRAIRIAIPGGSGPVLPPILPTPAAEDDLTPPPAPTGLAASGALANIIIDWNPPNYLLPRHAYTEIWRAAVDDLGQAVRIGQSPGALYADNVGDTNVTRYYWIRFVSTANVAGPFNATSGTIAVTGFVLSPHLQDLAVTAGKIADGAIDLGGAKIAGLLQNLNLAVIADPTKIADSLIGNTKLAELAVTAAKIANGAVDADKIANLAVGTAAIQTAAITTALIANLAVGSAQIADAAITSVKIGSAAVGSAAIANLAVQTAHITDGAILNAKIGNLAVDTAKIVDLAVVNAKIANLAVDSAKIADAAITTAKIATLTVTTAHIVDANITTLKLAGQAVTIPVSAFTSGVIAVTSTTAPGTVVQTVTYTSTGAPVSIFCSCAIHNPETTNQLYYVRVRRNSTIIYEFVDVTEFLFVQAQTRVVIGFSLADVPPAGSVTYDFLFQPNTNTLNVLKRSLTAIETKR